MKFTSLISIFAAMSVVVYAAPVSNTDSKIVVADAPNGAVVPGTAPSTNVADVGTGAGEEATTSFVPFYITSPLTDTTYTSGSEVTTTWINGVEGPFKINLITGTEPTEMQPTDITFNVKDGRSGSYTWRVPENLPSGKYAYKYMYKSGGKDAESYSSQFTIKKGSESSTATKPAGQANAAVLTAQDEKKTVESAATGAH